ncbi:PAS domain-containing protein [Haladaptatus sp. NG-SE-30]
MCSERVTLADALTTFDSIGTEGEPIAASELATELDCPRQTATEILDELAERGDVNQKTIGDGNRVWWRPVDSGSNDQTQFRSLVDAVEEYAIFMLDPDGHIVTWNEGAKQIKGYDTAEIIGEHFSVFYTDEDVREDVPTHNLAVAANEGRVEDEGWRVRKNGSRFWANVTISAIRDEDGTLRGYTKVTRDMTERRENERQIREDRDLIEQVLETVPLGISVIDSDGTLVRANSRAIDRLGIDPSNLDQYGVSSWELHDEDGESIPPGERPFDRVVETGEPVFDYRCQADLPGQGRRWLSINAVPIGDADDEIERLVYAVEDVTEQKERTRQLRRERNQTERLLETSPIAISVRDADGTVLLANRRAQELLGLSEREIIEDPEDIDEWKFYDADGEPIEQRNAPVEHVYETGEPVYDEEIAVERPGRKRMWFSVNSAPVYDSDGNLERVITASEDITELKARERELERRKSELETELSEIFGRISDAFYALDEEWRFTHVNERAEEITRHSAEEMLGKNIWEAFPEAATGIVWDEYHEAMETQEPTSFEMYDGDLDIWVEVNAYPSETGLSVYFRDITERKEHERALEESERRYRTLAEHFPNGGINLFDGDLQLTLVAGQAFDDLDMEVDELEGRSLREAYGDEVADLLEPTYRDALAGKPDSVEFEYADREWVVRAVPVTDDDGDVFAGLAIAQDITDRKERERALEESEQRYRTLAENFPNGSVVLFDHDLQYTLVEGTLADRLDIDPDEMVGHPVGAVHPPGAAEEFERNYRAALEGYENSFEVDYNGRVLRVQAIPVRDDDGEVFAGIGMSQDVTERVEQRRALEESEQRYRALAENFPDGAVGIYDHDLRYTLVEGTIFDEIEPTAEDLEGKTVSEVFSPKTAPALESLFRSALDGQTDCVEVEFAGRIFEVWATSVRDADGEVFAGLSFTQDITDRKEREQKLEQFASVVSHDLRNPLGIAQGYLTMARKTDNPDDFDEVEQALDRMETIIQSLLTMAREGQTISEPNPTSLPNLVESAWRHVDTGEATLHVDDATPMILADETRLQTAFENLFRNAIEHGKKTTDVRVGPLDAPENEATDHSDSISGGFYVEDDGVGIGIDEPSRVFEYGYSGSGGTGFGLAIVREIIQAHGWEVSVTESESGGARFEIRGVETADSTVTGP